MNEHRCASEQAKLWQAATAPNGTISRDMRSPNMWILQLTDDLALAKFGAIHFCPFCGESLEAIDE